MRLKSFASMVSIMGLLAGFVHAQAPAPAAFDTIAAHERAKVKQCEPSLIATIERAEIMVIKEADNQAFVNITPSDEAADNPLWGPLRDKPSADKLEKIIGQKICLE